MLFYLILAILTAVLTELSFYPRTKIYRILISVFSIGIPSFFYAVRLYVGTDYYNYVINFLRIKSGYHIRMEIGYVLLNKLCAGLNFKAEMMFFIISLIFFVIIRCSLADNMDLLSPGLGMFVFMLFYYQISFNAVRQMVAMSILLYSFRYIVRERFIKFVLCITAAATFHLSSLIFIPAYIICKFINQDKSLKKSFFKLSIIIVIFIVNCNYIISLASDVLRMNDYSKYLIADNSLQNDLGFFIRSLPFISVGLYLYTASVFDDSETKIRLAFILYIVSVILQFSIFTGGRYINRLAWNYEIILVLLIPFFYRKLSYERNTILRILLLCYVLLHWWFVFIYSESHQTVPYKWIYH